MSAGKSSVKTAATGLPSQFSVKYIGLRYYERPYIYRRGAESQHSVRCSAIRNPRLFALFDPDKVHYELKIDPLN